MTDCFCFFQSTTRKSNRKANKHLHIPSSSQEFIRLKWTKENMFPEWRPEEEMDSTQRKTYLENVEDKRLNKNIFTERWPRSGTVEDEMDSNQKYWPNESQHSDSAIENKERLFQGTKQNKYLEGGLQCLFWSSKRQTNTSKMLKTDLTLINLPNDSLI